MGRRYVQGAAFPALLLLAVAILAAYAPAAAAADPAYAITYTITLDEGGSAAWQVEYRTLLATEEDTTAFEQYAEAIDSTYLPQFKELMERSSSQAAIATARPMVVSGFSGTSDIQTSPTGKYGVILYSFTWDGFAQRGDQMVIGDAFVGGLYLPRDATLIVRYPATYSVVAADPAADQDRDGLTWYGLRSFGAGEPRLVLERSSFPLLPAAGITALVLVAAGIFLFIFRKSRKPADLAEPGESAAPLSEDEIVSLQERIVQMLRAGGGEMYQSDIVRNLGLPKSTVSAALNDLHARKVILKVRKGRENLIRLAA